MKKITIESNKKSLLAQFGPIIKRVLQKSADEEKSRKPLKKIIVSIVGIIGTVFAVLNYFNVLSDFLENLSKLIKDK